MNININVYGESHFHKDEVDTIRDKIIKDKPNIILLENIEDKKLYEEKIKDVIIKRLEPIFKNKELSLLNQFILREDRMIKSITSILNNIYTDVIICIQVGDTHLRTIKTKELGDYKLRKYLDDLKKIDYIKLNIIRSKYKEIN